MCFPGWERREWLLGRGLGTVVPAASHSHDAAPLPGGPGEAVLGVTVSPIEVGSQVRSAALDIPPSLQQ